MNLSANELTRNLSANIRPHSSQLTEPLWTDPGLKNKISVRELISTLKKKKKRRRRRINDSRRRGKSYHHKHPWESYACGFKLRHSLCQMTQTKGHAYKGKINRRIFFLRVSQNNNNNNDNYNTLQQTCTATQCPLKVPVPTATSTTEEKGNDKSII